MEPNTEAVRSEAEFVSWADEIRRGAGGEMSFVWAIMRSPWASLHWELIQDETLDAGFRRSLRSRFPEHGASGRDFLLGIAEASDASGDAILTLGKMCDPLLNGIVGRGDVRDLALRTLGAGDPSLRRASVIALGWVGDAEDVEAIGRSMSADDDPECRVAAVGALVQLLERHLGDSLAETVERTLRDGAERDHDPEVRDAAAEARQQIAEPTG